MEMNNHSSSTSNSLGDPQNIIAIAVTLISVCALVVSVFQTKLMMEEREIMHEFARASVWPRLELGRFKGHRGEDYRVAKYELRIKNSGIGPAIITDVRLLYDGKVVTNWWELFEHFDMPDSVETYIGNGDLNRQIVKEGDEGTILNLNNNLPLANFFYQNDRKLTLEVFYQSIYKQRWKLTYTLGKNNDFNETVELTSYQPIPDSEQFEN